jgi:arylsulfatase A-like enzyme
MIFVCFLTATTSASAQAQPTRTPPNIVFIIADDLGYGDLGCYGQKKIRTPNIDHLAGEGMRFTTHYSGSNVCAPSRCVLMTGKHPGHGYIRENQQAKGFPEGQEPVPAGTLQLPFLLKKQGYTLGGFGKWGLGPVGSSGDPLKQGFDRWYGYNCQAVAHNYYPTHLWDNDKQIKLDNPKFSAYQKLAADTDPQDPKSYAGFTGKEYAPDLIGNKALDFVRANKDRPFFLYYATTVPHLALQVPEDSLKEYAGKFPETPYIGDRGYLPHQQPRAAYAAMITRMDRDVGKLLALLKELDLDERTIVVFTSDNGPLYDKAGGTDADFFDSAAGLKGRKGSFDEGGFREPCLVRYPGRITAGSTTDRVTGFEDWLPTLLELIGARDKTHEGLDGISFAQTLLGKKQEPRPFLYRESPGYGGQQCVRVGDWKAIRKNLNPGPKAANQKPGEVELYDLASDPSEKTDVAAKHPEVVVKLRAILEKQHVKSDLFPMRALDGGKDTPEKPHRAPGMSLGVNRRQETGRLASPKIAAHVRMLEKRLPARLMFTFNGPFSGSEMYGTWSGTAYFPAETKSLERRLS